MTASDPFDGPKLLLEGAREEIENFDAQCLGVLDACFGVPVVETNANTGERVLKYRIAQRLPGRLRVLASNAVNNMRHVLDQCINCAAIELGAAKRSNYFPFAKDASEIDRAIKDRCKTVPPTLIPVLKAFQPYGGGDDLLYSLSQLSNSNKHRLLLSLNVHLDHYVAQDIFFTMTGPGEFGFIGWDGSKQELEVARVPVGGNAQCHPQAKLPLYVTIKDSEAPDGEPATTFLHTLAGKIQGVLSTIEAETIRLKAI